MIELDGVSKRFGDTAAVEDLDLTIREGELTVLVGPSGCGKTTCLRMVNRLEEPSGGRIRVNGADIMAQEPIALRRGIGYVMQSAGLFPHRRIRDNIATVPYLLGWAATAIDERVAELAELVGLDTALLARYPHALSGGQQQRAGVARALAADPAILLMDEPFGAVDPVVRQHLQDELLRLQRRLHKTIVFVTHDIDEAIRVGDRVAVMRAPGELVQYDNPRALLAAPADAFVTDFLGHDRELRRLALIRTDEVEPTAAPIVAAGAGRRGRGRRRLYRGGGLHRGPSRLAAQRAQRHGGLGAGGGAGRGRRRGVARDAHPGPTARTTGLSHVPLVLDRGQP
ncbi:MAG: proline/glycine betaine ABC transporter ATP-binding protein [Proteobacteria bacterium SW_6_67_9]|nr:MAG: proline/glycine betaine ABC transporter ATP-binding protein [Proteobacteria bacterium SW_6_67_9]